MICLILCIILNIASLIGIIRGYKVLKYYKKREQELKSNEKLVSFEEWYKGRENEPYMATAFFLSLFLFALSIVLGWGFLYLGNGISKPKQKILLKEKERIVYYLEQKDQYFDDYIKEAKQYNKDVNEYNSYWYRFNIEDRSEYEIDIEYYTKTN